MSLREEVQERLRGCGIAPTRHRVQIGMLMLAEPCHMSADQVLQQLRDTGSRVSKATVYNTLNLFSRQGVLREVVVGPERRIYDSTTHPHHHFYNVDSGELADIESSSLAVDGLPDLPEGTEAESIEVVVRIRNQRGH